MLIRSNPSDQMHGGEELVIHFPDGIPAFGEVQNFALCRNDELRPFVSLTSVGGERIGLLCICPFKLAPDYTVKLNQGTLKTLMLEDPEDVLVLALVTQAGKPQDYAANLLAPLVINLKRRLGKQLILEKYPVRVNVLGALRNNRSETMGRN